MTDPNRRTWTPESIKQLHDLRKKGHTFSKIAGMMKLTKGQVMGVFGRYIGFDDTPIRMPVVRAVEPVKPAKIVKPKPVKTAPNKPANYTITKQPVHNKESIPLVAESVHVLKPVAWPPGAGKCGSIVGEARGMVCCGQPVMAGSQYCPPHHAAFYVPNKVRV